MENWIKTWKDQVESREDGVTVCFKRIMQRLKDLVDSDLNPKGSYEISGFSGFTTERGKYKFLSPEEKREVIKRLREEGLLVSGPLPYRDGGDTYTVGVNLDALKDGK